MATIAETFEPPAWSCGTTPDMDHRSLFKHGHDDNRDHFHHDHRNHDHDHDFKPSNTRDAMSDLKHSIRGSELHLGNRRVQGGSYSYWVDVYIEIDYEFCVYNGETELGPNTINYSEFHLYSGRCFSCISFLFLKQSCRPSSSSLFIQ